MTKTNEIINNHHLLVHVGPHEDVSAQILHGEIKLNLLYSQIGHIHPLLFEAGFVEVRGGVVRRPHIPPSRTVASRPSIT